tara:strand:+ start:16918 stop:17430 length:513 start_codon:yes stop_codon:yes gene_type:complete
MELVDSKSEILKTPAQPFDFSNPPVDPEKLFNEMLDFMCENKGIGLSAPQVGLPYAVFVMGDPGNRESGIGVFNPKIVDFDSNMSYNKEGCLSFPHLFVKIKRADGIRTRFQTWDGDIDTMVFQGMTAKIFQHEYDHLDGIVFTKRANRIHLDSARRKQKKALRILKRGN